MFLFLLQKQHLNGRNDETNFVLLNWHRQNVVFGLVLISVVRQKKATGFYLITKNAVLKCSYLFIFNLLFMVASTCYVRNAC